MRVGHAPIEAWRFLSSTARGAAWGSARGLLGDEFIGNGHEKWEVSMGNSHCKWVISMDEGFLMSFFCVKNLVPVLPCTR